MTQLAPDSCWSPDTFAWIGSHADAVSHPEGACILREGQVPGALFFVLRGHYMVCVASQAGRLQEIGTVSSGMMFGEMAWLSGGRTSATVIAKTDAESLVLQLHTLEEKLSTDLAFAAHFFRGLARFMAERQRRSNQVMLLGAGAGGLPPPRP